MGKVRLSHGMKQLLADDPCSPLVYAVEQVQAQAHYRRLGRVLRRMKRRKYETGWVHATEAANPCDRAVAAMLLGYRLPREDITPQHHRIFDNGTYMHLRFSNYFLSLSPPFSARIAVVLRHWPIIGEADAILVHPETGEQLIELKSINDNGFKALRAPQQGHTDQINTYLGMCPAVAGGQVWYENKNNQDIKTFPVQFDAAPFDDMLVRIEQIADHVINGRLPAPCGECEHDEWAANLKGVEGRMAKLAETREKNEHDNPVQQDSSPQQRSEEAL